MASIDFEVDVPSAEELKNMKGDYDNSPLEDGVYICRINKVELRKSPTWVNGAADYTKMKLEWSATLSPVKQLSGDPLQTVNKTEAKPLSSLIWKKANPFAIGMKQDGTPSNLRALFAYGLGLQVDAQFKVSGIVVLDKNEEIIEGQGFTDYVEEFKKLRKGEIQPDQAKLRNEGYKHIYDLGVIEGKYIVASLAVDGNYNKVIGLSKVPASFDAAASDAALTEEIKKFNEVIYPKILENRKAKALGQVKAADNVAPDFPVTSESVSIEDIPF